MRKKLFSLKEEDIASILGLAPNSKYLSKVGFKDFKLVLEVISTKKAIPEKDIKPVPKDKLHNNKLSESVEILIRAGMRKSKLVGEFFDKWTDPELGDKIAQQFNDKYEELKNIGLNPDMIFASLLEFAEKEGSNTPAHRAAALAVLSYLFEHCDIFEGKDDTSN
ncbi:hypothetical protein COY26_02395 [Candidatus Woesearchaeota archaeon CG_4_10_14_0_2_um_filter_33_10]|nr:MAG: hypothetical protein COS79_00670 [Candidatus Woesearchaeota archaeon CG06_land_8_20_14_3_00_33_13]PIZ53256.1 MAG: hypothetical protein COY26_02395 [Candidatus Woesearchaeota archaeon CG_4_10_14_0_2_um_filter_33_10]